MRVSGALRGLRLLNSTIRLFALPAKCAADCQHYLLSLLKEILLVKAAQPKNIFILQLFKKWVAVISAKNHKRQRRKRRSVTAKRKKSQTPKVLTAILTLPNLT